MSDDKKETRGLARRAELVPVANERKAVAKRQPRLDGVFKESGTTLVAGKPYVLGDRTVTEDAVYFVRGLKPTTKGPWLGEADKIAWLDAATGYECIIMRSERGGRLSGYVGVPVGHPLHGFEHEAVPVDLGIDVHGGLSYSKTCQQGPSPDRRSIAMEARRICHVPRTPHKPSPFDMPRITACNGTTPSGSGSSATRSTIWCRTTVTTAVASWRPRSARPTTTRPMCMTR